MTDPFEQLGNERGRLASEIAARHFDRHPELEQRYGAKGLAHCTRDAAYHLQYLEQSLRVNSDYLFADYVRWAKVMLESRHVPVNDLISNLATVREVVARELPALAPASGRMLDAGIQALSAPEPAALDAEPHAELAAAYLSSVLNGERNVARKLVMEAIDSGLPLRDIYLHVFQPAQYEIGRLWQCNEIGVADEHLATAITQMIMSQLYPLLFSGPRKQKTFVSACVGGELHEFGARMVADFFEMDGWTTYSLGANTPIDGIVKTICDRGADVAGLSVTISFNIAAAQEVIAAVKGSAGCRNTRIIVGGYPFKIVPDLWKTIGAHGYAADAVAAVAVANQLVSGGASRALGRRI